MKKKTIYLHIGFPKTGTTSIQRFLTDNSEKFLKYGIYYPILDFKETKFSHNININGRFITENENYKEIYKKIIDEFDKSKNNILVFSDERFVGRTFDISRLKIFNRKKYNFKIICYLKKSVEYLAGAWQENLRLGRKANFMTYALEGKSYLKRIEKVYQYKEYFKKENIILRTFEQEIWKNNNLIEDFLSIITKEDFKNFKYQQKRENVGFSRELAEKYLYLNNFTNIEKNYSDLYLNFNYRNSYIENLLKDIKDKEKQKILSSFPNENIKQVSDKYYPLECQIAKDFLNKKELFKQKYPKIYYTPRKEYNKKISGEEKQELRFIAQCTLQQKIIDNQKIIMDTLRG